MGVPISNEYYDSLIKRSRHERMWDFAIGGTAMLLVFVIIILVVPRIPVMPSPPIAVVNQATNLTEQPVCPGDSIEVDSKVFIRESAVVGVWTSIRNDATHAYMPDTTIVALPVPREITDNLDGIVKFTAPELPPGKYTRVAAFAALNRDSRPSFMLTPFEIDEGCPPMPKEGA